MIFHLSFSIDFRAETARHQHFGWLQGTEPGHRHEQNEGAIHVFFMGRLMVINGENRMKNHWKFGRIILISTILRQTHMLEGITDKCLTYEFKTATISV